VQVELAPHGVEFLRRRVAQRDPDEAVWLVQVVADLFDREVNESGSLLVGNAVDEHGFGFLKQAASAASTRAVRFRSRAWVAPAIAPRQQQPSQPQGYDDGEQGHQDAPHVDG
jgi:hypothetical protein